MGFKFWGGARISLTLQKNSMSIEGNADHVNLKIHQAIILEQTGK